MEMKNLDIFCEIIDNYGDIGVVYRLAKEFKQLYGENLKIRVFLNRLDEFIKINNRAKNLPIQEIEGIDYITIDYLNKNIYTFSPANVIIEAFGCGIQTEYFEKAKVNSQLLINLEYLSGESWIDDVHLMQSPLGDCKLRKYFFMPGFSLKSGGVIVDSLFLARKREALLNKEKILKKYILNLDSQNYKIGTLFSYEKNFEPLFEVLEKEKTKHYLFILGEKTQYSVKEILKDKSYLNIDFIYLPFLNQEEYEKLISIVDYNFVRGEDSFVRALLTGKPFVWHIYLQDNMAHMDKIEGFINSYKRVISNSDKISCEIHTKLLRDYNFRDSNDLKIGIERYEDFFKNLADIEKISTEFSNYLENSCNLIDKLNKFILEF